MACYSSCCVYMRCSLLVPLLAHNKATVRERSAATVALLLKHIARQTAPATPVPAASGMPQLPEVDAALEACARQLWRLLDKGRYRPPRVEAPWEHRWREAEEAAVASEAEAQGEAADAGDDTMEKEEECGAAGAEDRRRRRRRGKGGEEACGDGEVSLKLATWSDGLANIIFEAMRVSARGSLA